MTVETFNKIILQCEQCGFAIDGILSKRYRQNGQQRRSVTENLGSFTLLQEMSTVGEVGDRRLVVRKYGRSRLNGKERPSLEIIHLNPTGNHYLDLIRYNKKL